MEPAKSFRDLIVWQRAHKMVVAIYSLTQNFPKSELFGLTSQFRRAAVSVSANIAEGFVRRTKPDKIRMLNVAQGSLEECKYYLILSKNLEYAYEDHLAATAEEVSKLLTAYIRSIQQNR